MGKKKKKKVAVVVQIYRGKNPKYDFACNQPKETFPKLLDMGCFMMNYEAGKSLVPSAKSELYI